MRKLPRTTRREQTQTTVTTSSALQTVATHRNRLIPNPRSPLLANSWQIQQVSAGRRNDSTYHQSCGGWQTEPLLFYVWPAGRNFHGQQYTRQSFKAFTETWGITHVTSSPHYVRSNGLAERYVHYIKGTLKKSSDIQLALLNIRATPVDANLPSPADMFLGRPLATLLPSRSEPGVEKHRDRMQERQTEMKDQHDKTSRKEDLPSLYTGQAVRILNHQRKTWCPGKIVSKCDEPRSYVVETPNGTRLRRNLSHLRELVARRELVASPAKTVRFSDEPARPTQTIHSMFLTSPIQLT